MAEEWRDVPEPEEKPFDFDILDRRRFNVEEPPSRPEPIFRLSGQAIATPGNLIVVQSRVKSGKSAFVGAMIASAISEDSRGDFLGISAARPNGKAIIHFDTEQSRYDADQIIRRALRRAGVDRPPPWLRSYCLTDLDVQTRRRALGAELERAAKQHAGVSAVFLDGVGDLVRDLNDASEANALVGELHTFAIRFDCPIVCVLHENPGANSEAKTRGHLGSQLERKAESNLQLVKDDTGVTVVYSEKSRNANITREHGPRFEWSNLLGMHRSCETMHETKAKKRRSDMEIVVDEIFNRPGGDVGLSWTQVHERIETLEKLKRTGARRRFDALIAAGLIAKNGNGRYTRVG